MRVLFRVALALLIGIPLCLALMMFFILDASERLRGARPGKPRFLPRA